MDPKRKAGIAARSAPTASGTLRKPCKCVLGGVRADCCRAGHSGSIPGAPIASIALGRDQLEDRGLGRPIQTSFAIEEESREAELPRLYKDLLRGATVSVRSSAVKEVEREDAV
jgi:hypothetical protein